ncbi:MAG: AMP-binding protein [Candidatus Fermentibacteraceae bacterium]|nr:AMP-binding protein [Candidatus Fermentibacteraceae bacterium]MBN2607963.1 AMP-binding protein [Candidatus Fermentibacteraceae bacterium]
MKTETSGGTLRDDPGLRSIPEALMAVAEKYPDLVAFSEPDPGGSYHSITYRELRRRVDAVARAMLDRCAEPVVGVTGSNSVAWAITYLAALRAGGTVVPIDRELPVQEMLTILHYSEANMMFFDERYAEDFRGKLSGRDIRMVAMNTAHCEGIPTHDDLIRDGSGSAAVLPDRWDLDRPAAICYTSGTTGQAKGVMLSQNNILANIRQMAQSVDIIDGDMFLSILPVHHTFECTCGFLFPVTHGVPIYICRGIRQVAEDMVNSGATILLAVPLLWEAMYRKIYGAIQSMPGGSFKYRLGLTISSVGELLGSRKIRKKVFSRVHDKLGGRMRLCISGGAGISPDVVDGFQKLGFTFLQGYGLTETAPIISVNTLSMNRVGSVGPALPGVTVRIDSPDVDGNGEILAKGPNIMKGYYNNPKATAEVLMEDGWFRTGDYGHIDDDGFIFITGRKKNVIVAKNGKNVYPEEIELVVGKDDFILECMVAGKQTEMKGEEIWIILVPDMEKFIASAEEHGFSLTTEYLADYMRKVVREFNSSQPIYKRIARFMIREDEFPKTTTRKVRRKEVLREAGLEEDISYRV